MTYDELIKSRVDHYHAEDWVYNYPKDIDSNNYSYFQDAALEIAAVAYSLGYKDAPEDITKGIVSKIYELTNLVE